LDTAGEITMQAQVCAYVRLARCLAPAIEAAGEQQAATGAGQLARLQGAIDAQGDKPLVVTAGRQAGACREYEGDRSRPYATHLPAQCGGEVAHKASGSSCMIGQQQEGAAPLLEVDQAGCCLAVIRCSRNTGQCGGVMGDHAIVAQQACSAQCGKLEAGD